VKRTYRHRNNPRYHLTAHEKAFVYLTMMPTSEGGYGFYYGKRFDKYRATERKFYKGFRGPKRHLNRIMLNGKPWQDPNPDWNTIEDNAAHNVSEASVFN
jgi:hypothetical protein